MIGSVSPARALQPLAEFVQRATTQSFDARESSAQASERASQADAALGALLPSFSARGSYTRNQYEITVGVGGGPEVVITPHNQWDAFLGLDVPLFDLAKYQLYQAAEGRARAATWQRQATVLDVSRQVAGAYYQYVGASALREAARHNVQLSQHNARDVELRQQAGAATDLDLQRALANVEQAKQETSSTELAVALAARQLETLSGLSPVPWTETLDSEHPNDDLGEEAALERWLARLGGTPSERAADELLHAADATVKAAHTTLLPTVAGAVEERFTNATGFNGNSPVYALRLTASWRLDFASSPALKAQEAAALTQRVRAERVRRGVADAVFEAHHRLETGLDKGRAARAQTQAAARALELAGKRYEAGAATQLDVIQAQRDAFRAQANLIQAHAELAYARVALRLAAGLPIAAQGAP